MKKEITAKTPELATQISNIDPERLPEILKKQMELLETANDKLAKAEKSEMTARKKVETALQEADDLIAKAKGIGRHEAGQRKFLWIEWTSKADKIETLKNNLKELVEHSSDSAEAQKKLVDVQSALLESQTSILEVQKATMEYQRQIAEVTKFIFGLSAYNMGISQSIYLNIEAILSNESPEKMGELAQQQLFLALDQIRNQESLITRISETEELIDSLNSDIESKQAEIESLRQLEEEQNKKILENSQDIDRLEQQDAEQDRRLDEGDEKDREQDAQITTNAQDIDRLEQQDAEQERRLDEGDEKDREQDAQITTNAQDIDKLEQQDAEQNELIELLLQKCEEQQLEIIELEKKLAQLESVETKDKKLLLASCSGAIIAMILAIINFFI